MLLYNLHYECEGKNFAKFIYLFRVDASSKEELTLALGDDTSRLHNFVDSVMKGCQYEERGSCVDGVFSLRRSYKSSDSIWSQAVIQPSFSVRDQKADISFESSFTNRSLNLKLYDWVTTCKEINSNSSIQRIYKEIAVLREGISTPQDFESRLLQNP
jgi:hypothetical protein